MRVNGRNLTLIIGSKPIGLATSCTVDITMHTLDARTKDDDGAYPVADYMSFSITSESVLGLSEKENRQNYALLRFAMRLMQPVTVSIELMEEDESMPAADYGFVPLSGEALITSLKLGGDVNNKATLSIRLDGRGKI